MKRHFQRAFMKFLPLFLISAGPALQANAQQGIINTFAGGGPNSPVALSADIDPQSVAVDASGNLFIAATWLDQVFKATPAGNFTLVAGNGTQGFGGDGGPAANATLSVPAGVAVDTHGNIFIADTGNRCIRRVDAVTGIITTVAGTSSGLPGFSGDGGPATSANMNYPSSVAVDAQGDIFIVDGAIQRVRRVDGATEIITTVAGSGVPDSTGSVSPGFSGDGGPATSAQLADPYGVALDAQGNLFIADSGNSRIRRVDVASHVITTVAGDGQPGFSGDGGAATSASLFDPLGVTVDAQGDLFVADSANLRVRRVDASTQIITTVGGDGLAVFSGDGGPATSAGLVPAGVAVDSQGDILIADNCSARIRRVDAISGTINTVVGGGSGGDGGAATLAVLIYPSSVTADGSGNLFIADYFNNRVRRVDAATGMISTLAGNGIVGHTGDGGPATSASLGNPVGVAVDTQGNVFIADLANEVIRRVDATTGTITTVAGNGTLGFSGDGGSATSASLDLTYAVAVDTHDNLFIADLDNQRIRRVDGATGIITTVAGSGEPGSFGLVPIGFSGDGGPATSAQLANPYGVALDAHGNIFIADELNNRVRRVDAVTGIITTVAGDGDYGDSGDGSPATSAGIGQPFGVAVDAQNNLFISSGYDVRRVDAVTGIITTVAGDDAAPPGFSGDGGPATSAGLRSDGLTVDAQGRLLIADSADNRIRVVPLPPFVAMAPASLSFSAQTGGTTSAAQTLTLTNTGLVPLTISSIAIDGTNAGDYAETSTCGGSLGAGANCAINVTFTPTGTGASTATLTFTDNAPGSPQNVPLSGTTQSPDFSLAVSGTSSSANVSAGQTATYDLNIAPLGGLSGTVSITCGGAPSLATCTVSPASVNLSGSAASPITVTVSTTASSGVVMRPKPPAGPWVWLWIVALLAALGSSLMGQHNIAFRPARVILVMSLLGLALLAGCGGSGMTGGGGGGGNPGTPTGSYTLTVSGSYASGSTSMNHGVTLKLTVNCDVCLCVPTLIG